MFLALSPAPPLRPLVRSYWFIQDLPGEHAGHPIRTAPIPMAVLSVNLGRPNATESGTLVPSASLLGLQSRARAWRSWSNTYFVMAMLTVPGIVRLFPHAGCGCADALVDLGALTGDALAGGLSTDVGAAWEPHRIAARLDRWLMARLMGTAPVAEGAPIAAAHDALRRGGTVESAAAAAQVGRRQLHRWFRRHLGIGPKELADRERLHSSLLDVQTNRGDPVAGFSDQAHQIRTWRHRLGVTPGAYRKGNRSPMAAHFSAGGGPAGPAFYL